MECCKKDLKLVSDGETIAEIKHTEEGLLIKCSGKLKEHFKNCCHKN